MADFKTPGVYIEEIPKLPPSIASVETAIPAFIGYTEKAPDEIEPGAAIKKPLKISSIFEYEQYYGQVTPESDIQISIDMSLANNPAKVTKTVNKPKYLMYYSLQAFFDNGGGDCYIVSIGDYSKGTIMEADLQTGLDEILKIHDVTLIVFPDAINMGRDDYYKIHNSAIAQCVLLKDRFTVFDVWIDDANALTDNIQALRDADLAKEPEDLKYAAVYYPRIYTDISYLVDETKATLTVTNDPLGNNYNGKLDGAKPAANNYYWMAKNAISNFNMLMPVSSAVVGLYAYVDSNRGVWKAPANVGITNAIKPEIAITNDQQQTMNVDPVAGKSVNVIRTFPGRGPAIVWGARTLAGNDNEWRYISVRRFFIMVETSVKNTTEQFVFEPNDENTWVRVKSMIENYLTQQWKAGALMGASTKEAFYVHIGLGQTMTELDIWEGRMIIQIGLAAVRPAEFIILQFMHKMLSES
jgi:phage tail sheath protein FI